MRERVTPTLRDHKLITDVLDQTYDTPRQCGWCGLRLDLGDTIYYSSDARLLTDVLWCSPICALNWREQGEVVSIFRLKGKAS